MLKLVEIEEDWNRKGWLQTFFL